MRDRELEELNFLVGLLAEPAVEVDQRLKNMVFERVAAVRAACQPVQRCGSTSAGCCLAKGHEGKHVLPGRKT